MLVAELVDLVQKETDKRMLEVVQRLCLQNGRQCSYWHLYDDLREELQKMEQSSDETHNLLSYWKEYSNKIILDLEYLEFYGKCDYCLRCLAAAPSDCLDKLKEEVNFFNLRLEKYAKLFTDRMCHYWYLFETLVVLSEYDGDNHQEILQLKKELAEAKPCGKCENCILAKSSKIIACNYWLKKEMIASLKFTVLDPSTFNCIHKCSNAEKIKEIENELASLSPCGKCQHCFSIQQKNHEK